MKTIYRLGAAALIIVMLFVITSCSGGEMSTLDKIRKNKQIVVGTDAVNIPFEFGKGMGVQGYDVDLAGEIAKEIGFEIRWVKIPFERLLPSLPNKDVDFVISAISITDERKKDFAFSKSYFDSGQTVAIRRETEKVKKLADLEGKRIGVQAGTTGDAFLTKSSRLAKYERKAYATIDDALLSLNNREIDAVIGDHPIISYSVYTSFPNLKTVGDKLTNEAYGIVFRKEDKELVEIANKVITRVKSDGTAEKLYSTWFREVEKGIAAQQKKEADFERLKVTPKTVVFRWIKDPSFNFKMSRLDGFNILLRHKETGTVATSTAIETSGNSGLCQISVIPGVYELSMKGYPLRSPEFEIPIVEAMTLTSTINLGTQTSIGPPK